MSGGTGAGGQADGSSGNANATKIALGAAGGLGCLMSPAVLLGGVIVIIIIGGFGVLLAPLIALILLFGGGGGGSDPADDANEILEVFEGDGKGELDPDQVPSDLAEPIQNAGAICDVIGPIVIAAQIERESNFNATLVGPDGSEGISQLPPAVFDEFGKDEDDNDKVSAFDAPDSIMAQGRYLCSLAKEVQGLLDSGQAIGSVLDLTLVAYDAGVDAVREAGGIPTTNQSQGYVVGIRALFAKYQGLGAPPPSFSPTPTPTSSGTPQESPETPDDGEQ
ncbi:lytic transglycosylase domain-containing protein [Streptomyces sp. NBC_01210]|uniref:lytic transglycosylase domain-containing protein n=1 Tax=Streptomyces sp. NBC_01210 TaxID=2903774 RepID=UPI002E15AC89|nr:lytic transglycosylase domain-containing protein [Streptomyces sp. NBC_01210]